MSEASDPLRLTQADLARTLPSSRRKRDVILPIVIALSVVVHATILLPLLFQTKQAESVAPIEIPIEIIQEPAKPEPPKPEPPKPPAPKPVAKQEPAKPQTSPEQAKQAEAQARVSERMRKLLGQPPPSLDPVALPGAGADGTVGASYQQLVMSQLTKALGFERRPGVPGFVVVTFVLDDRGAVASVAIDRPSGDPVLDSDAIAVVKRGAPYPPPPPGSKRQYTVTVEMRPVL